MRKNLLKPISLALFCLDEISKRLRLTGLLRNSILWKRYFCQLEKITMRYQKSFKQKLRCKWLPRWQGGFKRQIKGGLRCKIQICTAFLKRHVLWMEELTTKKMRMAIWYSEKMQMVNLSLTKEATKFTSCRNAAIKDLGQSRLIVCKMWRKKTFLKKLNKVHHIKKIKMKTILMDQIKLLMIASSQKW